MRNLLFVASNWTSTSFDLWEEESSDHFYTRMVQRRALLVGTAFATMMGDSATASTLSGAATAITATLPQFWDVNRQLVLYEYGPVLRGKSSYKDVAVVLGIIHGYAKDGVYGYTNDQILASAYQIATSLTRSRLRPPMPFLYRASDAHATAGSLTPTMTSLPFFAYFAPDAGLAAGAKYKADSAQFRAAAAALQG
ncbi:Six-hairpin glycosidase-like protein [Cryomyces antarcticus]